MLKICVYGAGAVGGHVAARLCAGGRHLVSLIARGPMLAAIRDRGLVLHSGGEEIRARPSTATDDPASLAPQDLVLVTLKAGSIPGVAAAIARLLSPDGCAIFLVNGVPWWWKHGMRDAGTLPLLDPEGALWRLVRPERALGAVVHSPNEVIEPGVVLHSVPGLNYFILGEPSGPPGARLNAAAEALASGGLEIRVTPDIRKEVLRKLLNNVSGNVLAALSRTDLGGLGRDPGLRELSIALVREALDTARALGWDLRAEVDAGQIASRGRPGVRPSMLQDVLAGRPMEVEAILGQIHAFAHEKGVPVPHFDALLPVLRGLDRALRAG